MFIGTRAMDTCRTSFGNIQHLIEINETLQLKVPPRVLSTLSFLCALAPCYRYARGPKSDPGFLTEMESQA